MNPVCMEKDKATLIPIAAGKGGVGKSLIAANVGIALAEMGYPTIVADMDLGGSNLHSFLGLPNRYPGIGDFLRVRNAELHELLVPTQTPNLKWLPGDGRMPFMANIPYAQKVKLISHVRQLPAKYILLDLGGGTTFNTLDFFRVSNRGILVVTPDYPSIMSLLAFLKHLLLRTIERKFAGEHRIRETLAAFYKESMVREATNMEALRSRLTSIDEEAGAQVKALYNSCRPRIIFNRVEKPEEIEISPQIDRSLAEALSLKADYFGLVFEDPGIRKSMKMRAPFLLSADDGPATKSIRKIAERIVKYWDKKIINSAGYVLQHARKIYENDPRP